jgi:hypothetical protein
MPLLWLGADGKSTRCEIWLSGREVHFVIRFRQQQDAARRAAAVASEVSVRPDASRTACSSFSVKSSCSLGQHAPAKIILHARLLQFVGKQSLGVGGVGHAFRLHHKRHGRRERDAVLRADRALRKVMEEMCPSPVARKLRMKRSAPLGSRTGRGAARWTD